MANKKITGRLSDVRRLQSSTYGNPRYAIVLDDQSKEHRTQIDGSVAYEVTNYRIGRRVTLTVDQWGAVVDMSYEGRAKA